MPTTNVLESDERGDYGEDRAKVFLRPLFGEITNRPSPDRGTDVICSGPRWIQPAICATTPVVRFQIKSGPKYRSAFAVAPKTLDRLLQRIEGEPIIVLYYHDSAASYTSPDCFLILNTWILANVEEVRRCLLAGQALRVPHVDFEHLAMRGAAPVKAALGEEFRRTASHRGHPLATRHDQMPEYSYIRQFTRVVRVWDIPLLPSPEMKRLFGVGHPSEVRGRLLRATEGENSLSSILRAAGRTKKHPLNRIPSANVEVAQAEYYTALLRCSAGKAFHLPQGFTVSESSAGRAMAAKYPNLLPLVEQVFHEWQRRPFAEVMNATQIAGVLSHYEKDAESRTVTALRRLAKEVRNLHIRDLQSYQLKHHVYVGLAEATGDKDPAKRAIDLASKFLQWELQHLEEYGWHVGRHVIDLYREAEQNSSLRGLKLREYNRGMRELMGQILC